MKPSKTTVYSLFEHRRQFVVPLYQRPYVWTREDQWEPLWEDIVLKAKEVVDRRGNRPHFLGAVVLGHRPHSILELDKVDIIDGQQRLTTIQVLLAAYHDLLDEEHASLRSWLAKATVNEEPFGSPIERFKVWPSNADREVFESVMTAGSRAAVDERFPVVRKGRKELPRAPLVEAYAFFQDAIGEYIRDDGDGFDAARLEALFAALRQLIQLVVIELEEDDDPQVIFECLNARGVPLLPSDLVRNFVFLRAGRRDEDPDELYQQWWSEFDERPVEGASGKRASGPFWKVVERQGRMKRPRLDLFLIHYLAFRTGHEVPHTHLFQEFKDWWEGSPGRVVSDELQELRRFADRFATFLTPGRASRLERFLNRLRVLDVGTVYPLLLYLFEHRREDLSTEERQVIVSDLESYLVRRMVCQLTTKNYNRFFLSLQRQLDEAKDGEQLCHALRARLLGDTGEAVRWPNDREFEQAWLELPVYQRLKASRVRMILEAIERQLRTRHQEPVELKGKLPIEHILPRAWQASWPVQEDPGIPLLEVESFEDARDRLLHTFGNLTLLTTELNATISNGPFKEKRPQIAQQSALRLNVFFQDQATWDEREILKRGRMLFETARTLWPYPAQEVAGFDDTVPEDRHGRRLAFWRSLHRKALERTDLHARVSPSNGNYLSVTVVRGMRLVYAILQFEVRVELYIDRWDDAENERVFQALRAHREEIEAAFGAPLNWLTLEGKRAYSITHDLPIGGYQAAPEQWLAIQDAMIDAMIRLEAAFRPYIETL